VLWELLEERTGDESISHKAMPTWGRHLDFVLSKPYLAWYIIEVPDPLGPVAVGAIYLTRDNEIGVSVYRRFRRQGFARKAIEMLMAEHDDAPRFLANIAPGNAKSRALFEGLGFKHIQDTLELANAD
jgi:RimJ/RimL family protein N-acetyltransferase